MLRLANDKDVPWLTDQMLKLQPETAWAKWQGGYDSVSLSRFLNERLHDPNSVCYVWDDGHSGLSAFCGTSINHFPLPPHVPVMFEWGWRGRAKESARCWRACCEWAKRRGAVYGCRVSGRPGSNDRRVCELVTWEKL